MERKRSVTKEARFQKCSNTHFTKADNRHGFQGPVSRGILGCRTSRSTFNVYSVQSLQRIVAIVLIFHVRFDYNVLGMKCEFMFEPREFRLSNLTQNARVEMCSS